MPEQQPLLFCSSERELSPLIRAHALPLLLFCLLSTGGAGGFPIPTCLASLRLRRPTSLQRNQSLPSGAESLHYVSCPSGAANDCLNGGGGRMGGGVTEREREEREERGQRWMEGEDRRQRRER